MEYVSQQELVKKLIGAVDLQLCGHVMATTVKFRNINNVIQKSNFMNIQRIISSYIITGSVIGILFSIGYPEYINHLLSIILFCLTLWAGIISTKMPLQKALKLYIVIFIFQLLSFKIGNIDFSYGVGLNLIHYIKLDSFRVESTVLSLSHSNIISPTTNGSNHFGINLINHHTEAQG